MPAIEVNPAKDMTRVFATEARRLGMSAQMVSSHKRPHNRKTGCIPYYIAAAMPQEEGRAAEPARLEPPRVTPSALRQSMLLRDPYERCFRSPSADRGSQRRHACHD